MNTALLHPLRPVSLLTAILLVMFLAGCSNTIEQYSNRQPAFDAVNFFNGNLTAHGVLKNRSGDVTRTFNATIKASWKDNIGTLDERFVFDDGEVQYRVWTLVPQADGSYIATAGDVKGEGKANISGNAMHLTYVLGIKYKGSDLDLAVDDWMFRISDDVVINESVLSKWGIKVGSIQLAIVKR